ncbi:hypothetical protein C6P40_000687 [Pichia californica]|uniref:t-SNARE coiled-coil homology domain-containing protein n=1 Tax=Pichia californica TaxID=460514 RepID=A0A9P6WK63_9ASCO|nr:hypothetical protein C6P40_000687 [[Candida] californica]
MEELQCIFQYIYENYNFNNLNINSNNDNNNTNESNTSDSLSPSITFNAIYSKSFNVKFTIAIHPGYDVPCIYFQIFKISFDDGGFETEILTFDDDSLNTIIYSHQSEISKNPSKYTIISPISQSSPIDLFNTSNNTYFYIHPSYTQARAHVLSLSTQLSNVLARFSSFTNDIQSTPLPEELEIKNKIQLLLSDLSAAINELSRILDTLQTESLSSSKYQQLARHRDELKRHRQDFQRIANQIDQERNRLNLLTNVRSDIDQYNDSNNNTNNNENSNVNIDDYMLDERSRVDRSHNIVDNLISQVMETRDEIMRQRTVLSSVVNRLDRSLNTIPGLNTIINKIDARHRKEALILVIVILICLIILWFSL